MRLNMMYSIRLGGCRALREIIHKYEDASYNAFRHQAWVKLIAHEKNCLQRSLAEDRDPLSER